jgi:hypothetical protein
MKKNIFIIISILTTIIILGIWAYLFTFGAPKSGSEIFANFGLGGKSNQEPTIIDTTTVDVGDYSETGAPQALKQLTTHPVAGATFTTDGNTVRYVEQGTGHLYAIDLTSGSETLLSGTTLPGTREASFSHNAELVAISIFEDGELRTLVGEIGEGATQSFTGVSLPKGAGDIFFDSATNTLMYTIEETTGIAGYSYNTKKETGTKLFSLPLHDARTIWGEDTLYVYTTPTASQTGYMYKVSKNELSYVADGGYGLMGLLFNDSPIITSSDKTNVFSTTITSGKGTPLPIITIPEKCAGSDEFLYCAVPRNLGNAQRFPDDWYKGAVSYSDTLWEIDVEGGKATVLSNFELESGRQIDVSKIGISEDDTRLYFINKNDNTLWMFDSRVYGE